MNYDSESGQHGLQATAPSGLNGNVKSNRYGRIFTTVAVIFALVGATVFISQSGQRDGRRLSGSKGDAADSIIPLSAKSDMFSQKSLEMSNGKYSESTTAEALKGLNIDLAAYDSEKTTLHIALQVI